ncbi:MAG: hypothetical protein KIS76_11990 [Pyrinomonadaceae bacterium]|nr:hypothetical protein [Pyrinomonadaceae bacterium]
MRFFLALITLSFLSAIFANAQTVADLEAKYGKSPQIYEVRPGVIATVKFDDNGQVREMRVERYNATEKTIYLDTTFPDDLLEEVVNELAPPAKRGAKSERSGDTVFMGGTARTFDEYENASITYFSSIRGDCRGTVAIVIIWKNNSPKQK